MKKIFLIAASAMMVLASCTKVVINYPEDAQPQEIAMFAVNKGMTKAPVSTFPNDYNMMVAAYQIAGTEGNTAGEYFNQKLFAKQTAVGATTWTGGQYWPISAATINFFAVAPEVAAAGVGGTAPVATTIKPYDATEGKVATTTVKSNSVNQYDVMYALAQGAYAGNGTYDDVDMTFNHALSWIHFKVKNGTTGASAPQIVVNSITLNKVYFDGTATITANNYTAGSPAIDATAVSWTADGTPETTVALPEESANYTLTLNSNYVQFANDGLLVIPHDYTNDNSKPSFTINYTVTQDNKSFTYDYTYTFTNGVKWDVGKKYVYKVSITLKEIEVKPEVGTWGDDNETTVDAQ